MLSIPFTHASSAWISIIFSSHSPTYGEQALEITNALVSSGAIDVVLVDSVAALGPKAELEGEMGDSFMGLHARLMSQALPKITGAVARSGACMIFINQVREKIASCSAIPKPPPAAAR